MRIGVPSEIKIHEYRVGLMPAAVRELVSDGHQLAVQSGAGNGVGCSDEDYRAAGAQILPDARAVFGASEMIVKVKEPQAAEIARLKPHHILFTYLHLAADPDQARGLMASGCTAVAYETVSDRHGRLRGGPLLSLQPVEVGVGFELSPHTVEELVLHARFTLDPIPAIGLHAFQVGIRDI